MLFNRGAQDFASNIPDDKLDGGRERIWAHEQDMSETTTRFQLDGTSLVGVSYLEMK